MIAIHRATWKPGTKCEQHWRGTLRHHVLPRIGRKRVDQITTADVMGVLLADDFWNRRNATAKRARQRISAVMKWSVAKGYREDNPAGDAIAAAMAEHNGRVQHHRALPRDPEFATKAGRVLDLYHRRWNGRALTEGEFVISADEKTQIPALRRPASLGW